MAPVVLGAGVAGLAAAVGLARAGLRPHVLEARPFVGGRARSFVHASTGEEIDNGQHLLMGCYHSTFRLLDTIGTRHLVSLQPRLRVDFRDADGTTDRLLAPSLPSPLDVLVAMMRLRGLSLSERVGLLRVARYAMKSGRRVGAELDMTVDELLISLKQSQRARARLWDPIVIATLNTPPSEASSELFIEVMRRAFLGSGDDSRLAYARVGLSALFDPALDYITASGGTVELGASVASVEQSNDGFVVRAKDGRAIECSSIISALPSHAARGALGAVSTVVGSGDVGYSPIVSIYLWYDRALDDIPEMTALIGTSVQWVFNRRRMSRTVHVDNAIARSGGSGLLACTISAANVEAATSADEVMRTADRELRRAFRELAGATLIDAIVLKEKLATFRALPNMKRPSTRTNVEGLYLAGDWTDTGLPATIEGAAQSGFKAAEALIADTTRD